MKPAGFLNALTFAAALGAMQPACSSDQKCTLHNGDPQAKQVLGTPIDENVCAKDLQNACGNVKALVCIVVPESMDSDIERQVIACGQTGTNGTISDMCKHSDVSYCYATDKPESVTMTCEE